MDAAVRAAALARLAQKWPQHRPEQLDRLLSYGGSLAEAEVYLDAADREDTATADAGAAGGGAVLTPTRHVLTPASSVPAGQWRSELEKEPPMTFAERNVLKMESLKTASAHVARPSRSMQVRSRCRVAIFDSAHTEAGRCLQLDTDSHYMLELIEATDRAERTAQNEKAAADRAATPTPPAASAEDAQQKAAGGGGKPRIGSASRRVKPAAGGGGLPGSAGR